MQQSLFYVDYDLPLFWRDIRQADTLNYCFLPRITETMDGISEAALLVSGKAVLNPF
ncbi:MAG: hypothetical protein ACOYJZ_03560 [Acutalibacter sp.]